MDINDNTEDYVRPKNPKFGDIEEMEDEVDKKFKTLKNFAVLDQVTPYNHPYYCTPRALIRIKLDKIKVEWELLRKTLPNTIYVRTYRHRVDLMRAAISGLEGTPFCHALFFFDIYIPHDYPNSPAIFYYNGKIEFSPDNKILIPTKSASSISQSLIWIQRSFLGARSCYDSRYFRSDNEAFVLCCKSMLWTIKSPILKEFRGLVYGYFRARAHAILIIYKNQIGKPDELFFRLVKVFEEIGAYCKHHYNEEERRLVEQAIEQEKKRQSIGNGPATDGMLNNMFRNIGCFF